MAWLRRCKLFGGVGDAFSHADTGPYAGAPRNPNLSPDDGSRAYSVVRYTTDQRQWEADAWQWHSHMPSAERRREAARRNVL